MIKLRALTILSILILVTTACGPVIKPTPAPVYVTALPTWPGVTVSPDAPTSIPVSLQSTPGAAVYPEPLEQVDAPQGRLALVLGSTFVQELMLHGDRLWGRTASGLVAWDLAGGENTSIPAARYTHLDGLPALPRAGAVVSSSGDWWYLDGDLFHYRPLGEAPQHLAALPESKRPLGPLAVDAAGRVAVLVDGGAADMQLRWLVYDPSAGALQEAAALAPPFADSTRLAAAPDGSLWLLLTDPSTGRQELARYDPAANTFQKIPLGEAVVGDIRGLAVDRDGAVYVGTAASAAGAAAGSGLHRYDPAAGWQNFTPVGWPDGLDVYAALAAPDGALWFGTRAGASRYEPATRRWEHFDAQSELAARQVTHLRVDAQGHLWFATEQGARRYDPPGDLWTRFDLEGIDLPTFGLFPGAGGQIWLTGPGGAIRQYDPASGQITILDDAGVQADPLGEVSQVVVDPGGALWAVRQAGELPGRPGELFIRRYEAASRAWEAIEPLPLLSGTQAEFLANGPVDRRIVARAGSQTIYLLGRQVMPDQEYAYRLWRYNPANEGWNAVELQHRLDGPAPGVTDMVPGAQGSLWFAQADGLQRFDPEQNTWQFFDAKAALGLARLGRLKSAPDGALWLRTERGLARFDPQHELWRQYLLGSDILPGDWTFLPDGDGSVWISHAGSLLKFTPGASAAGLTAAATPTPPRLWTPTPGVTPSATPTLPPAGWFACTGALTTRLYVGLTPRVVKQEFMMLNVRSAPEITPNNVIARLPGGTRFKIIGGPHCHTPPGGGAFIFWQIRFDYHLQDGEFVDEWIVMEGWAVESIGTEYVIER